VGSSDKSIGLVERFRREGVDVVVDQYPYDHSSTSLSIVLPTWALAGGRQEMIARMKDAETATKIKAEMLAMLKDKGFNDYSYAIIARFKPETAYEGKTSAK